MPGTRVGHGYPGRRIHSVAMSMQISYRSAHSEVPVAVIRRRPNRGPVGTRRKHSPSSGRSTRREMRLGGAAQLIRT